MTSLPPHLRIVPLSINEDIDSILHLSWDVFQETWARSPPHPADAPPRPSTEAEFIVSDARPRMLLRLGESEGRGPRVIGARLVDTNIEPDFDAVPSTGIVMKGAKNADGEEETYHPTQTVALVIFFAPHKSMATVPTIEERKAMVEKIIATMNWIAPTPEKKQLYRSMMMDDPIQTGKILGEGYETKYFELGVLVTATSQQRKGYGSTLVNWGLDEIEKRRKEEGFSSEVKGTFVLASLAGCRTYEKAGFREVGRRIPKEEAERLKLGPEEQHVTLVKPFSDD